MPSICFEVLFPFDDDDDDDVIQLAGLMSGISAQAAPQVFCCSARCPSQSKWLHQTIVRQVCNRASGLDADAAQSE